MILTATSESTRLVEYEWTINGAINAQNTKDINVDIAYPDVVSVKALNDCGNWSQSITMSWDKPVDTDSILMLAIIGAAVLMMG